jgi:hypothetical protein
MLRVKTSFNHLIVLNKLYHLPAPYNIIDLQYVMHLLSPAYQRTSLKKQTNQLCILLHYCELEVQVPPI